MNLQLRMDLDLSTINVELTQVRFFVWLATKEAKRATQLKSVHAWPALFGSNFIGTINFIAKISGQRNKWKRESADVASLTFCGRAMDGFVQHRI